MSGLLAMKSTFYKRPSATTLTALTFAYCLIPPLPVAGWKRSSRKLRRPEYPIRLSRNPIGEMCTDDSESRTEYFDVPVVRFEGPRILLNGVTTSANDLLRGRRKGTRSSRNKL
jgi:hypothetical protein